MFTHVSSFIRKVKHRMSGIVWLASALGLPTRTPEGHEPGLIMIQVDGLSYEALQRAITTKEMPFMRHLGRKEGYQIRHHYSGIPSSTPAVQGELFYGVKQCVPAFKYLDSETKEVLMFFYPENAAKVEERLSKKDPGLLKGGSSYGNIFSGGAEESHFCVGSIGAHSYWKTLSPYSYLAGIFFNPLSILKALCVGVYDLVKIFCELFRGILNGSDFVEEIATIPVRLFVSIFLHDFITLGARMDIVRGLPIISLNFFAYDELAHRHGADAFLPKRTLASIDRSIRKIWKTANRSLARDYELWIYSDHGQESTLPYRLVTGKSVEIAVNEVIQEFVSERVTAGQKGALGAGSERTKQWRTKKPKGSPKLNKKDVVVTAQGPLGFIYVPFNFADDEKTKIAAALVEKAKIPLVLARNSQGQVHAWTMEGRFNLPGDGGRVFGLTHPYLEMVSEEMVQLCKSVESGTFVISGWRQSGQPISFPLEWASHGGPGVSETDGFAFLPMSAALSLREGSHPLRPSDLRDAAKKSLDPEKRQSSYRVLARKSKDRPFRVMSYNVHRCVGMDRHLSPARIAKVIARHSPDVVVLQELEHHGQTPGKIHQPEMIAKLLDMTYHFHPAMRISEEHFGDAILSRYPMRLVRAAALPGFPSVAPMMEPRGALWVEIDCDGQKIQLLATHLSVVPWESEMQTKELLGPNWLGHEACCGPIVFCADLNSLPHWKVNRNLRARLRDTALKPAGTWISALPFARIDYIYASSDFQVIESGVPRMALERIASDHLPVIADLAL